MGIEIEKKYRLTDREAERIQERLRETGAVLVSEEFEENLLYSGGNLDGKKSILRLRLSSDSRNSNSSSNNRRATLTYKERFVSDSAIKHQREDETRVDDPTALAAILSALGFEPTLVYEKRRATWQVGDDDSSGGDAEVVVDQLPFGIYAEIEGDEASIIKTERLLKLSEAEVEMATYPELTVRYGTKNKDMIEARFT